MTEEARFHGFPRIHPHLCDAAWPHSGCHRQEQGHSFFVWWVGGTLLFIVAPPLAIILKPREESQHRGLLRGCGPGRFYRNRDTVARERDTLEARGQTSEKGER